MWERICHYAVSEVKIIEHILLYCCFYEETGLNLISPLLRRYPGCFDHDISKLFLMGDNPQVIVRSIEFVVAYNVFQENLHTDFKF